MRRFTAIKALLLTLILGWGGAGFALAAQVGSVSHLSGPLFAQNNEGQARALSVGSAIDEGDTLVTQANTFARIRLKDDAEILLRPNTQLQVRQYTYDQAKPQNDNAVMRLLKGSFRAVSGWIGKRSNQDAYRMETPTATIGIRGTDYDAGICDGSSPCTPATSQQAPQTPGPAPLLPGLYVFVNSGSIQVSNGNGTILLSPGQFGFAPFTTPPIILPSGPYFPPPPPSVGLPGGPVGPVGGSLGPELSCIVR